MDATFWHQKWSSNDIAFHENEFNPQLLKYLAVLALPKGSRVLVPLCGKTLDIAWLLAQGYRVAGIELSELAVEQLFMQLNIQPKITDLGQLKHYGGKNIDLFVGDIFALSQKILGAVDAIYDRAALVALPSELRQRYSQHLVELSQQAPQLLICYDYDQTLQAGPPFSISSAEVNRHYQDCYDLKCVESIAVVGGVKGQCPGRENVWLLTR